MIDVLISDISSQGSQVTTCFVIMYPGYAISHMVRKGRDLFLGSYSSGPLTYQKHRDGRLPQGWWSGKQAHQLAFTDFLFHSWSPDLLTWKVTVL